MQRAALFDLISGRAGWLAQRQAVLTRNVANADTPKFQPLDLVPASPARLLATGGGGGPQRLAVALTSAAHAAAPAAAAPAGFAEREAPSYETAPAGNGVVLGEQLEKMAATDLDYQLTTGLYRRYVGMVRTALGAPQS
jgi:flagellar basal-body rod protein FlgB